jgi:DMSO/TMAO reductase YedYZ molybdopterin-dependent catalytic subunit
MGFDGRNLQVQMRAWNGEHRISRRPLSSSHRICQRGGACGRSGFAQLCAGPNHTSFANGERELVQFPQKRKLILLTHRPPQLETPFAVFNGSVITPNDAFFVRYHLANIPLEIDPAAFRLEVKGLVQSPLSLSLENLRKGLRKRFEVIAGQSMLRQQPRASSIRESRWPAWQWARWGNAKWRGARLKDVLEKGWCAGQGEAGDLRWAGQAGHRKDAGLSSRPSISITRSDGEILVAYEMNGADLPMLNGYPIRLVVPGLLRHLLGEAPQFFDVVR